MDIRDQLTEHVPRLRRYARALLHNVDLADDLVQDTLERALDKARQFQPGSDLRAWLFAVMHSIFVNQVGRASARASHLPFDDWVQGNQIAGPDRASGALEIRDLGHALQRLPAEQREVVLLVGLEEMSYVDVARALDIPVGTVMSRLSRGRERLRLLMTGVEPAVRLKVVK